MILLALLLHSASFAKTDFSRCQGAGIKGDASPYRLSAKGSLQFDRADEHALFLSSKPGKKQDELTFFEYSAPRDRGFRVGQGLGAEGVIRVQARLLKAKGLPLTLETTDIWYPLDGSRGWPKMKAGLHAGTLKLTKGERTRETESWIRYGYSGARCYVAEEGIGIRGHKLVTFDQALCNRVLKITDADPTALLKDFRGTEPAPKANAVRVLRLIRDAQVAVDEKLRVSGRRLQAVELTPPELPLPGTMPAEDSAALQELRGCVAAHARNGFERPESSRENSDFMGDEPELVE